MATVKISDALDSAYHGSGLEEGALRATYTSCTYPWALIRRHGETDGKHPATRMAYLVDNIVEAGKLVAYRCYVGRSDMTGWTKTMRRVELGDVIRGWRKRPMLASVQAVKKRMPVVLSRLV